MKFAFTFLLACSFMLASTFVAQAQDAPKDDAPKPAPKEDEKPSDAEKPAADDADKKADADADSDAEAPTYELKQVWKVDTTYTAIVLGSVFLSDSEKRDEMNVSNFAIEYTVTKLDEDDGSLLEFTAHMAKALAGNDRFDAGEEAEVKMRDSKLVGLKADFTRASASEEWAITVTELGGMDKDNDEAREKLKEALKPFVRDTLHIPFLNVSSEAQAVGGSWEYAESEFAQGVSLGIRMVSQIRPTEKITTTVNEYVGTTELSEVSLAESDSAEGEEPAEDKPADDDVEDESDDDDASPSSFALLTTTHDGIVDIDLDGRVLRFDGTCEELGFFDMTLNSVAGYSYAFEGDVQVLFQGAVKMSGKFHFDRTMLFGVGSATDVIEANELEELFKESPKDEEDRWAATNHYCSELEPAA